MQTDASPVVQQYQPALVSRITVHVTSPSISELGLELLRLIDERYARRTALLHLRVSGINYPRDLN